MISPRMLLASHNIHPRKQMGQNFLNDPSAAEMIVRSAGISEADIVLEIGAGLGALTIPASKAARKVFALDKDRKLIEILASELAKHRISNVELLEQDILKLNFEELHHKAGKKLLTIGNLPYYISSQILVHLIESRQFTDRAVLMFQKELAQRLMAAPGSKDYGRISVMLQYCADIRTVATVRAAVFFPKPLVDSVVIDIRFKPVSRHVTDEKFLFKVIKAAFGNRRKTLKNSLAGSEFKTDPQLAEDALSSAGIDPVRRAETLSVEEFVNLSEQMIVRIRK